MRYACLVSLIACSFHTPAAVKITIDAHALQQALGFGNSVSGAALAIACADGTSQSATPIDVTSDPIAFSEVTPCGQAHLVLTARLSSVTAFVGTADANLTPGDVPVDFSGPLYGELVLSASDGDYTCSINGTTVTASAVALTLPLPVGGYGLSCTSSSGAVQSFPESISPAQQAIVVVSTQAASQPASQPSPPPPDSTLNFLSISPIGIAFQPDVTSYDVTLPLSTALITVSATPNAADATVTINGVDGTSSQVPFSDATIDITVEVTDQGLVTDYIIHVTRSTLSDDTKVDGMSFSGTLSPTFDSNVFDYVSSISFAATNFDVTGSLDDSSGAATAQLLVNGVPSGSPQAYGFEFFATLPAGNVTITVRVTAADSISTADYTIVATRLPPNNDATLADLGLNPGALVPGFSPTTFTGYTALVSAERSSIGVLPQPNDFNATMTCNGTPCLYGQAFNMPVTEGSANPLSIVVTAQDGVTILQYNMVVTVGLVSSLDITDGTHSLAPAFSVASGAIRRYDFPTTAGAILTVSAAPTTGANLSVLLDANTVDASKPIPLPAAGGIHLLSVISTDPAGFETDDYLVRIVAGAPQKTYVATAGSAQSAVLHDVTGGSIVTNGPVLTPGGIPVSTAVDPYGKFVYFSEGNQIEWFQIDSSNSYINNQFLTPAIHAFTGLSNVGPIAMDPEGRCLYALSGGSGASYDTYQTFPIATDGSGALSSPGAGSLVNNQAFPAVATNGSFLAVDPQGREFFVDAGGVIQNYFVSLDFGTLLVATAGSSPLSVNGPVQALVTDPTDTSGSQIYFVDSTGALSSTTIDAYGGFGSILSGATIGTPTGFAAGSGTIIYGDVASQSFVSYAFGSLVTSASTVSLAPHTPLNPAAIWNGIAYFLDDYGGGELNLSVLTAAALATPSKAFTVASPDQLVVFDVY